MKKVILSIILLNIGYLANGQCSNSTLLTIYGSDSLLTNVRVTDNTSFSQSAMLAKDHFDCFAWTDNTHGSPLYNERSIFKFNLTSIPSTAVVKSAKLFLYPDLDLQNFSPGDPTYGTANSAIIEQNTTNWDISTLNWNNMPTTSNVNNVTLSQSSSYTQSYVLDITAMVQDWVYNPTTNFGGTFKLDAENYYNSLFFNCGTGLLGTQLRLEICYTNILPLQLLSFEATQKNSVVQIKFTTYQEKNINQINIQRSFNGLAFETIDKTTPSNQINSEYNYIDKLPSNTQSSKTLYYRLEIVDKNGNKQYSEIKKLILNDKLYAINVYPNPTTGIVNIECTDIKLLLIVDYFGKIIKQFNNLTKTQTLNIKQIPRGIYFIKALMLNNEIRTEKLIVE